ncbi:hypothetical protein LTR95_007555 [Oleoguttula sp. CCFEE 5521]
MRLLNIHTLELKDFVIDSDRPPYAIASHRWGAEEITYKDLVDNRARCQIKAGYRKLQGFCAITRRWNQYVQEPTLQCEWVWVDTCCINKSESAEVSEAINSMFAWYSTAVVCWAYLEDVFGTATAELQGSVWFKRGWTLQELLAPRTVIFLSHHWHMLGHKCWLHPSVLAGDQCCLPAPVLNRDLAVITGIPEEVLYRYAQSKKLDTKVKLGWVKGRETTRVEDMSYCLFGIFSVFLPTLYGEKGNARERLIEINKRRKPTTYLSPASFPCLYTPEGLRVEERFLLPESRPAGSTRWLNGPSRNVGDGKAIRTPVPSPASRPGANREESRSNSGQSPFARRTSEPDRNEWLVNSDSDGRYNRGRNPSNTLDQRRPMPGNSAYQHGPVPGETMYQHGPI